MKLFFLLSFFIYSFNPSYSQDTLPSKSLDEIIITANRFLQKSTTTGKVISIIDQDELKANASKSVAEIIQLQTSTFISGANSAPGSNKELYLRGANHGNVLILIDGISVNDPSLINNSFDLNHLNVDQIDRIEILKGAQSTLWGSDAVAGVINIISKKSGLKKLSPNAMIAMGSYTSFKSNIGLQGRIHRFSYHLGYGYDRSKGFSAANDTLDRDTFDKDGIVQNNAQLNLKYQWTDHFAISSLINHSTYQADIDAGAFKDDRDYTTRNRNGLGNIRFEYELARVQWYGSHSMIRAERAFTDDSTHIGGFSKYAQGNYIGKSQVSELYGVFKLNKLISLVSGLQRQSHNTDQHYLSLSSFGPFETSLGDTAQTSNISFYSSISLSKEKAYSIEAGWRLNHHNIYGNNNTFTINPSIHISSTSKLSLNIASAFKVPSLYQLYSEYGNRKLQPEKSINYELSYQLNSRSQNQSLRLTAFKRNINDLIVFYFNPTTFESQYINRDSQYDYGYELEHSVRFNKKANWKTNFSFINGHGIEEKIRVNNLYHRPKVTINSMINLHPNQSWTITPSVRYVGKRLKGLYDAGTDYLSAYTLFDCSFNYLLNKQFNAFLDLRNITNKTYYDVPGYNNRRFNTMIGVRYAMK